MFRKTVASAALALAFSAAARADVVIGEISSTRSLFFVEGERVYRLKCPSGTVFFDRETCNEETVQSDKERFFALYRSRLGVYLQDYDKKVAQAWMQAQAIDAKLFEILNTAPSTATVTDADLDAANDALAKARAAAQGLRDQLARLELALGSAPYDTELRTQLETTRTALGAKQRVENERLAALNDLRLKYVKERGSQRTDDFKELVRLRQKASDDLDLWKKRADGEVQDMERGEVLIGRALDAFAWPPANDAYDVAERFERAYIVAEVDSRTKHFLSADRYRMRFTLDDGRAIQTIKCKVSTQAVHGASFIFNKMKGQMIEAKASQTWDYVQMGLMEKDMGQWGGADNPFRVAGLIGQPSPGDWDVGYYYATEPTGPIPSPFQPLDCAFVFER